jgi:hypothetical protein
MEVLEDKTIIPLPNKSLIESIRALWRRLMKIETIKIMLLENQIVIKKSRTPCSPKIEMSLID